MGDPLPVQSTPPPKRKGGSAFSEKPPILQDTPPPVQEASKPEKPKSVSGFIENTLDDAWDLAKGLYEIIPSTIKSYQKNIPYILKNADALTPGMVGKAVKETAGQVAESVAEPYKKHGLSVAYHRPVTVASDIITVLTLGGGSIKNAGKMAKAAGGGAKAERLIEIGKFLEELPGKAARQGVDLTVKTATGGKLDLAKRRQFLQLKGEEQGRRILKIEGDVNNVVKKIDALTPDEKVLFHKARVLGDAPGIGVPDAAIPPNVKAALDAFTDLVDKVDPKLADHGITEFYKSRGYLNAETAETTLAKKFALEAFDDVSPASIAKAKELMAQSKRKPVYGQNVFVDDAGKTFSADTVLDDMMTGGKNMREGKVGSLETMKGAKGYTKDPSVYVREMIKNFRNTEAKARLSERLLESPQLIKGSGAAMDAKNIPEGIHRKYYEDSIRAEALKAITDPTIQRLLKWEYLKNNSSLVKVYDRLHGIFARSATMYNPKWVTGNIVGDAVLGLLAGSDWVEGMRHLKRGNMPAQIAGKNVTLSTEDILRNPGKFAKAVGYLPEKAADVAGWVDQATRAGIVHKEVGRRLKETALSFEGSAATFEDVLRSTDRFSDVQVQMRLLEERAARGSLDVRTRDAKIIRLQKREQALHSSLLEADARHKGKAIQKAESGKTADIRTDASILEESRRRIDRLANAERLIKGKIRDVEKGIDAERTKRLRGPVPIKKNFPEHFDARIKDLTDKLEDVQGAMADLKAIRDIHNSSILSKESRLAKAPDAVLGGYMDEAFRKGADALGDVRQKIVNLTKERDMIVRDITDDLAKSGELERLVPGLKQQVDILRPAVERANAFVGDYIALDGFEQGVMRRLIPFYPWAKAMSLLAFRLPFIAPVKSFAWNRFSDALSTLAQDPDLPDDFKGRVPVAVTKDGKTVWMKVDAYSPFGGLKSSQVAGIPVPQMFNVAERNPFIGLAFQFVGGKTIWDVSSIPYGEQMVSIGDGTVLRVKPNGKIEREIPQTPLVSGIMHTFPTTQLIQQVFQPYWTNKYNWAGIPEPVLNSDGSYRYPRELWDRLGAAVGLNLMSRSREEIVRSRKMKAIKNVREMQAQYKRTQDPDEREFILNATRDYIQQEVHGVKR